MITAALSDRFQNDISGERFAKAFAWLASTALAALEPGRNEIDGDDIFANVMTITSSAAIEKNYEAHRAYADIHCVIAGEERIGIAPVAACDALQDFDEAGDFSLYTYPDEDATWVVLHPGDFCVTPPADAHKPACCGPAGPAELRKVCVKVRL